MNYYITPPTYYKDQPVFTRRFYFKALVRWADQEYNAALIHARDYRLNRILSSEWSGMRLLSQMEGFHFLCAQLAVDTYTWEHLDHNTRKFICKALEWYEGMRETKVN